MMKSDSLNKMPLESKKVKRCLKHKCHSYKHKCKISKYFFYMTKAQLGESTKTESNSTAHK